MTTTSILSTDLVSDSRTVINANFASVDRPTYVTVGFSHADYICDGVADDVQILAAITQAIGQGGGIVFIREGTYSFTSAISLTGNTIPVVIMGEGDSTILSTTSSIGFFFGSSTDNVNNMTIKDLLLNGNSHCSIGIDMRAASIGNNRITIQNTSITGNVLHGINIEALTDGLIQGNKVYSNGARGMYFTATNAAGNSIIVDNNIVDGNGTYGIQLQDVTNSVVSNNVVKNHLVERGIYLSPASYCTVIGNDCYNNNLAGIGLNGDHNTVSGNVIKKTNLDGILLNGTGGAGIADNNVVSGNFISECARDGIEVNAFATYNLIVGNYIETCGQKGVNIQNTGEFNSVTGNYIYNTGDGSGDYGAIHITQNSSDNLISENYITADPSTPLTKYGIRIGTGDCDRNRIYNNFITGILNSQISGAGTDAVINNEGTIYLDTIQEYSSGSGLDVKGIPTWDYQGATLASDTLTVASPFTQVSAQTGTTDDLSTITSSLGSGSVIILKGFGGHTITVKNGVGNIVLDGTDRTLSGTSGFLYLIKETSTWYELSYANRNGIVAGLGFQFFNTTDQTTNYERVLGQWSSNIFEIASQSAGTGTTRALKLSSGTTGASSRRYLLIIDNGTTGTDISFGVVSSIGTTSNKNFLSLADVTSINSSNVFTAVQINPTITQTSTAGYTALLINPTESTTGSGVKSLVLVQVGSDTKFLVDNTGIVSVKTGLVPVASDGAALGTTSLMWSDLFLASGGVINWNSGDVLITHSANLLAFTGASSGYTFDAQGIITTAGLPATLTNSTDSASNQGIIIQSTRATPTNNDQIRVSLQLANSVGTQKEYGRITMQADDVVSTSEDGRFILSIMVAGSLTNKVSMTNTSLFPSTSDGIALGGGGNQWSDLFLASGGVLNFNNGDVTITHSADVLSFAGAASGYKFDNKFTNYNGVNTAGQGVPAIYASGRSAGAIAAVVSVATYTLPAADGSFEVSANVLVTTATLHSFNVTCTYTDEGNTSRTVTMNFSTVAGVISNSAITQVAGAVPYEGVPLTIRCKASTAITIATTGTFTTVVYNVEGFITQLS